MGPLKLDPLLYLNRPSQSDIIAISNDMTSNANGTLQKECISYNPLILGWNFTHQSHDVIDELHLIQE